MTNKPRVTYSKVTSCVLNNAKYCNSFGNEIVSCTLKNIPHARSHNMDYFLITAN